MKTKTLIIRYTLEFFVIILGVSISFYIEKQNALKYKETIKNQSLKRILNNSKTDNSDFEFNLEAHQGFVKSSYWILQNQNNLSDFSRDSTGYHLGFAIDGNTFFIDNTEEYRGLKNSGLIELIENDSLVSVLQNKHAQRVVITKMEEFITGHIKNNAEFLYTNNTGGNYPGGFKMPQSVIQNIEQKLRFHQFYIDQTIFELKRNAFIEKLIKKEIAIKE